MKNLLLAIVATCTANLISARAQEATSLPFPVNVGGPAATYEKGEPFASLARPVKNDEPIEVTAKADQLIIINVHKSAAKGAPSPGVQPAVILLQGTNKDTLAGTMDKRKLAATDYIVSVVTEGKTSSILFKIQ